MGEDSESRAAPVVSDIEGLERAVDQTVDLLERVSDYVNSVLDEEREPSNALGQFLMNALCWSFLIWQTLFAPKSSSLKDWPRLLSLWVAQTQLQQLAERVVVVERRANVEDDQGIKGADGRW